MRALILIQIGKNTNKNHFLINSFVNNSSQYYYVVPLTKKNIKKAILGFLLPKNKIFT